jgi:hypothetical protein
LTFKWCYDRIVAAKGGTMNGDKEVSGVVELITAAAEHRDDQGYNYCLSGDLGQMSVQKEFLMSRGMDVGQRDVYPALRNEDDFRRALGLIWGNKIEGWWNYSKNILMEYEICTEDEFMQALEIACARENPKGGRMVTSRPWYDSKDGIAASLVSLEKFLELVQARHEAGYSRGERLRQWVVLGRYWLDTCGNCWKAKKDAPWNVIPKEAFPDIPDVVSEFEAEWGPAMKDTIFSAGGGLPHPHLLCPHCHKGWTIRNCHDTIVLRNFKSFSLVNFVGKTLGEVRKAFSKRRDAIYVLQPDTMIRNDRFIDHSPEYPGATEDWEKNEEKIAMGGLVLKTVLTITMLFRRAMKDFLPFGRMNIQIAIKSELPGRNSIALWRFSRVQGLRLSEQNEFLTNIVLVITVRHGF